MARLPRLMGRGRALEVLLGAEDIPGDLAERYGYVNRSLPDSGSTRLCLSTTVQSPALSRIAPKPPYRITLDRG
jgi:enoyl-CoA hydratase/carnithine racemase